MLLSRPPSRFHFFSFSLSFSPTFNSLSECLPFSLSPSPFSPCPTHPSLSSSLTPSLFLSLFFSHSLSLFFSHFLSLSLSSSLPPSLFLSLFFSHPLSLLLSLPLFFSHFLSLPACPRSLISPCVSVTPYPSVHVHC